MPRLNAHQVLAESDAVATILARIAELREAERRHGRLTPVGRAMVELGERWLALHASTRTPKEAADG